MNIKKVAVLGAGAVGSYVIWGLSNNKNITLGVVADGERNERLKNQGLMINGTKIHTASVDSRRSTQCGSSDRIFKIRKSERDIKGYSDDRRRKHNGHESDEWS